MHPTDSVVSKGNHGVFAVAFDPHFVTRRALRFVLHEALFRHAPIGRGAAVGVARVSMPWLRPMNRSCYVAQSPFDRRNDGINWKLRNITLSTTYSVNVQSNIRPTRRTGEYGDLLDVIRESCGLVDFQDVTEEARRFLSLPRSEPESDNRPHSSPAPTGSPE
jgi:hypothetical protein